MTPRRIGWLAMALVLVGLLLVGVSGGQGPRTLDQRAQRIAETLMCPTCRGQSVADSDSSASRGIRNYIDQRMDDGASDDQIRDELANSYGDDILLTPERSGLAALVWLLPVVAVVVGVAGIALAFRRWRGHKPARATAADRSLVEKALAGRQAGSEPRQPVPTAPTGTAPTGTAPTGAGPG